MGTCSGKRDLDQQPYASKTTNVEPTHQPHSSQDLYLIDPKCSFLKKFRIEENTITYIGENWYTQLLGNIPISQKNSFSIKVLETHRRDISIGVVDEIQKKQRVTYSRHPNIVFYSGSGEVHGDGENVIKQEGTGFYQGDTVITTVNKSSGEIVWKVNGVQQASYIMENLKNRKINWVPYLMVFHTGDKVQWLD